MLSIREEADRYACQPFSFRDYATAMTALAVVLVVSVYAWVYLLVVVSSISVGLLFGSWLFAFAPRWWLFFTRDLFLVSCWLFWGVLVVALLVMLFRVFPGWVGVAHVVKPVKVPLSPSDSASNWRRSHKDALARIRGNVDRLASCAEQPVDELNSGDIVHLYASIIGSLIASGRAYLDCFEKDNSTAYADLVLRLHGINRRK